MIPAMKWLLPLFALVALRASADTTIGPAIDTIPITIKKAGVYHLTKNLGYTGGSGAAITVNVPQVIIDMNGFQIECTSGSANTAVGVTCTDIARVTVKNGTFTGFHTAVSMISNGATISDLLITTNFAAGISVTGNNVQITKNRVFNTGGAPSTTDHATGISLTGTDCTVTDNDVQTTFIQDLGSHSSDGIKLTDCANVYLADNRVLNTQPAVAQNASSTGIGTVTSENLVLLGNTVITAEFGFDLSGGASGEYGENTTTNDGTRYNATGSGMTDIGSNN